MLQGSVILVKRKSDGSRFVLKRMFIEDQAPEDQAEVMNEIKVSHPDGTRGESPTCD